MSRVIEGFLDDSLSPGKFGHPTKSWNLLGRQENTQSSIDSTNDVLEYAIIKKIGVTINNIFDLKIKYAVYRKK